MAITHKFTLMCDQVRKEDSGKWLLIGVFEDTIGIPVLPAPIAGLTFFMQLESDRPGGWNAKIRLEHLESGTKVFEGLAMINFQRPGRWMVPMQTPGFQFTALGAYQFVVEIQGQEPNPIIHDFQVSLIVPQRPSK